EGVEEPRAEGRIVVTEEVEAEVTWRRRHAGEPKERRADVEVAATPAAHRAGAGGISLVEPEQEQRRLEQRRLAPALAHPVDEVGDVVADDREHAPARRLVREESLDKVG